VVSSGYINSQILIVNCARLLEKSEVK